ncbi:MAG: TIGR00730 family Rossman fold protein [Patescibacteria group bacterium]
MKKEIKFKEPRIEELVAAHPDGVQRERLTRIMKELIAGFRFLRNYGLSATFFGSSRVGPRNPSYQEAYKLAYQLSKQGFAVITGGGPGIMEAANKGAYDAGGQSAGLNIMLPKGQRINKYVKESEAFDYFFIRKMMLAFASEVYIFFPGGFGTLDEFFEIITLVQTKKMKPIPILLVGKSYWQPLVHWIEEELCQKRRTIDKEDMKIYHLAASAKEAFLMIQKMVKR